MWRRYALVAAVLPLLALPRVVSAEQAKPPVANIVNGVPTQDYPVVGALLEPDNDPSGSLFTTCTATLIGCDTVLTAAHCFCTKDDGTGTLEPAGQCVSSGLAESVRAHRLLALQNAGAFAIKSVAIHPDFQPYQPMGTFALVGDLAVLKLATPVTGIPPAHINTLGEVPTSTAATIVGFGETGLNLNDGGLKRSGTITTVPCIDPTNGQPEDGLVCWKFESPIGLPGRDSTTCEGDSGGTLIVDLESGLNVAGVTSGGLAPRCAPGAASFDADVYSYRTWIAQAAGADLNSTRCGDVAQLGENGATSVNFSGFVSGTAEDRYSVEVPPNSVEVRFALNGEDYSQDSLDLNNQFDLVVNYGTLPTPSDYLCLDNTPGPYGFCAFTNPAPGTWYVAIPAAGVGFYQLTVTTFLDQPTATATFTPTSTFTRTPAASPTKSRTSPPVPSSTPAQTPPATQTPGPCYGDCNDDGVVTVAEIIMGVNMALGTASPATCSAFDPNGEGTVTVDTLIRAIGSALNGCRRARTAAECARDAGCL